MQWLPPVATQSASIRSGPTPEAKRRHGCVEEVGRGDDMTGTARGRIGTLASEASGVVLRVDGGVAVEWVEISKVGMVATAQGRAGFAGTIVPGF